MLTYPALGQLQTISIRALVSLSDQPQFLKVAGPAPLRVEAATQTVERTSLIVKRIVESPALRSRVSDPDKLAVVQGSVPARAVFGARRAGQAVISTFDSMTLATETVIAEGLRQGDYAAAKAYEAEVIEEALDGKVLLKVDTLERAFGLVELLLKRDDSFVWLQRHRRISDPVYCGGRIWCKGRDGSRRFRRSGPASPSYWMSGFLQRHPARDTERNGHPLHVCVRSRFHRG